MKCLVTAGPTFESLDQVRRLTNFSTGTLGTGLAEHMVRCGHEVTLLLGEMATVQPSGNLDNIRRFTSTSHLRQLLEECAGGNVNAVYHAAAVSDFRFGRVWERTSQGELREVKAGKISTGVGNLQAELIPTPKIIAELRSLFPQARLVGWKYEVDGNRASAISKAKKQLRECLTDYCVANGPAYGKGFGFVSADDVTHAETQSSLFEILDSAAITALTAE
jgi:phosphopantothenoylcysteine decarboxylase/phosphopantothenate--cysteine ligase